MSSGGASLAYGKTMGEGVDAEERGAALEAARLYRRAIALSQDNAVAHLFLAHALLTAGKLDAAAQVASLGQAVHPGVLSA